MSGFRGRGKSAENRTRNVFCFVLFWPTQKEYSFGCLIIDSLSWFWKKCFAFPQNILP